MGRAVVTKGHGGRRLGRTIHRLEESVELSPKESKAKIAEQQFREKVPPPSSDDSPVENLKDALNRRRYATSH